MLVLRELVENVAGCVIGYEPRVTGSFASCPAATRPHASAVLPVMLVYSPTGSLGDDLVPVADGLGRLAE